MIDPVSNLDTVGSKLEVRAMLTRVIDFLKSRQITSLATSLAHAGDRGEAPEMTSVDISSLMDTWILLRNLEYGAERNRVVHLLKSRGMAHSNQVREFVMSDRGIDLTDVYVGGGGVLTGSARRELEAKEREAAVAHQQDLELRQRALARKRVVLDAQLSALRTTFEGEEEELGRLLSEHLQQASRMKGDHDVIAQLRGHDGVTSGGK